MMTLMVISQCLLREMSKKQIYNIIGFIFADETWGTWLTLKHYKVLMIRDNDENWRNDDE